jgi:GNAT superfamily N-acetyltransferase
MCVVTAIIPTTDRQAIFAHLMRLPPADRRLRFCSYISDYALRVYCDRLFTDQVHTDTVYAIRDEDGLIVAMAHVAIANGVADIALSVEDRCRGLGLGHKLFARAIKWCQVSGAKTIQIMYLSENLPIQRLVAKYTPSVTSHGSEKEASLEVPELHAAVALFANVSEDWLALADVNCTKWLSVYVDTVRELF